MRIILGSDHAAIDLRLWLADQLVQLGHEVSQVGAKSIDSYDYPDAADELAQEIDSFDCGILICGTGIGISIRANRYPGIRAALCTTEYMAAMAREHNDANVLALGARVVGTEQALAIVKTFLSGEPSPVERHQKRIQKLGQPLIQS